MRVTGRLLTIVTLLFLAGCGADGEPVTPTMNAGIGVSSGGDVHVRGGVGLSQGPISLFFGF